MPDDIHDWVGYEARLWKMPKRELDDEAERLGCGSLSWALGRKNIIARILEKQGIDPDLLANPPQGDTNA